MSIPKDGYYSANIWNDDGRVARDLVLFTNGTPRNEAGLEVGLAAIENLRPATLEDMCACWPKSMAMELQALRTANAGLVESIKDRERERDHANDTASAVLAENAKLMERVRRLEEAGDEMFNVYPFPPYAVRWQEAKEAKP